MSEKCKCGHEISSHHYMGECCSRCSCVAIEPESKQREINGRCLSCYVDSVDEWLDAPTPWNVWWCTLGHENNPKLCWVDDRCSEVIGERRSFLWAHEDFTLYKWQRVRLHSPIPQPLPKSRQVTLTAKVLQRSTSVGAQWFAVTYEDGTEDDTEFCTSKQQAIQWVRDTYGVEPEVAE